MTTPVSRYKLTTIMRIVLLAMVVAGMGLSVQAGRTAPPVERGKPRRDRYGDPLPAGALVRLGTLRLRHRAAVHCVVFSPDGKILASTGMDESVRLWDAKTGAELRRWEMDRQAVHVLAFSPDGKLLACGDRHGNVHLRAVATGKLVRTLPANRNESSAISSLVFTPDGRILAAGNGEGVVHLWETASGTELRHWIAGTRESRSRLYNRVRGDKGWPLDYRELNALAFSADGKTLATGTWGGTVCLWETATGKRIARWEGQANGYNAVAFAKDSQAIAITEQGVLHLLDAKGRELRRAPTSRGEIVIRALAFSPNGKMLASGDDANRLCLWDAATGTRLHSFEGSDRHCGPIESVAFSPDGKTLASAGVERDIRLWDTVRCKEILPLQGHRGDVTKVAFSRDGKSLATAGGDHRVRLWDTRTGAERAALPPLPGGVNGVAFSADDKEILAAGWDGILHFWNRASGKEEKQIRTQRPGSSFYCLAMTRDGRFVATGELGFIRVWDVVEGTEVRRLKAETAPVWNLVFSPDGKTLAFTQFRSACVWNPTTGLQMVHLGKDDGWPLSITYSPDGRLLAAGKARSIRLLNANTGAQVRDCEWNGLLLFALAFAPDGKTLISSGLSGDLCFWEVATGRKRYRSPGHEMSVEALAFSADGRMLATASRDTTALLWDMSGRGFVAPVAHLSEERLTALWGDLSGEDAERAYRAACTLCQLPKQAVPFLEKRCRQQTPIDLRRIPRLIRDLDDAEFTIREQASRELAELGDVAESALRQALEKKPSLEARRRAQALLEALSRRSPSARRLRALRVTEVLERMDDPLARRLLETLAGGAPEDFITVEAKASLRRLGQQSRTSSR